MTPEQIITMAANGNQPAEDFARAWYQTCRMLDDAYDRDTLVTDDRIAGVMVRFMTELMGNDWFAQHRAMFYGVMVVSSNAWLDANRRAGAERAVLAGMYHEVIYLVAYVTGGWQHLRSVTSECREYKPAEKEAHGTL